MTSSFSCRKAAKFIWVASLLFVCLLAVGPDRSATSERTETHRWQQFIAPFFNLICRNPWDTDSRRRTLRLGEGTWSYLTIYWYCVGSVQDFIPGLTIKTRLHRKSNPNSTDWDERPNKLQVKQINGYAAPDGHILWTLANLSWLDFVLNWVAAVNLAGIDHFFVATMDDRCAIPAAFVFCKVTKSCWGPFRINVYWLKMFCGNLALRRML